MNGCGFGVGVFVGYSVELYGLFVVEGFCFFGSYCTNDIVLVVDGVEIEVLVYLRYDGFIVMDFFGDVLDLW